MRYVWNRGRSVEAQVVGETVEAVAGRNGGVCPPSALVDEARPKESALHGLFQWDDYTAAEAYRREQARHVVRELRVVSDDASSEPLQAFVHVIRVDGQRCVEGYRLTQMVVRDAGEYRQVLDEALAGLRAWQKRYGHLSELAKIWEVIDREFWRG